MAASQLVEKLKFGEKYILANIVVLPLDKAPARVALKSDATLPAPRFPKPYSKECEFAARNKFLTGDVWESFVYRKLYDLLQNNLAEHGSEICPPNALNKVHLLNCVERPYLQMKYSFRDTTYRNDLNMFFEERAGNLHDCCIYVEISDIGRTLCDKVVDRDRTILRLLKEINELKRGITNIKSNAKTPAGSSKSLPAQIEEYYPEPVKKRIRSADEEYVPENGASSGVKRMYKPSRIVDGHKPNSASEPDPYTPETTDTQVKVCYTPTSSPQNKVESHNTPSFRAVKVDKSLFGPDDAEEYDPANPKPSPGKQTGKNDSEKDMFSDSDHQHSPKCHEATDPKPNRISAYTAKRAVLPRSSKQSIRDLDNESSEEIERRKAKTTDKSNVPTKGEGNKKALLKLKKGINRKTVPKKEVGESE